MKIHSLKVNGIGSEHCVVVITNTAGKMDGAVVRHTKVGKAGIELDELKTSIANVVAAIEKMGYKVES